MTVVSSDAARAFSCWTHPPCPDFVFVCRMKIINSLQTSTLQHVYSTSTGRRYPAYREHFTYYVVRSTVKLLASLPSSVVKFPVRRFFDFWSSMCTMCRICTEFGWRVCHIAHRRCKLIHAAATLILLIDRPGAQRVTGPRCMVGIRTILMDGDSRILLN
jgi:hypothetical protein